MLNYQRNRSYHRGTPTPCAVAVFGLGVVLTLAGIIVMVITKNSRSKDELSIESDEEMEEDKPIFNNNIVKRNKARSDSVNNALKSSGPIVLGTGITIIVLFFLVVIAVAWSKGLKASSTRSQLPAARGARPNIAPTPGCHHSQSLTSPSPSSTHILVPKRHCGQREGKGTLPENPPAYDEINSHQWIGECSKSRDGTPAMPV